MRILILSGGFGMGHISVAKSIETDILNKYPDTDIKTIDMFRHISPTFSTIMYKIYNMLINFGGKAVNAYYKKNEDNDNAPVTAYDYYYIKQFSFLIATFAPDIIISVFPYASRIVSKYKQIRNSDIPLVTCITDVSSHSEWINNKTDAYLVASHSIKQKLIKKGIEPERIYVSGIPVREQFRKGGVRKSGKYKKLIIMGGGLGLIPKDKSFYDGLNKIPFLRTTVITGKNEAVYKKLNDKYKNITVIRYTDKVYKYMSENDFIITKPGGITVFEAINANLPLIILSPFLEQEIKNAHFIEENGLGVVIWHVRDSLDLLLKISKIINDDEKNRLIRKNMKEYIEKIDEDVIINIINKFVSQNNILSDFEK